MPDRGSLRRAAGTVVQFRYQQIWLVNLGMEREVRSERGEETFRSGEQASELGGSARLVAHKAA